ncbi:MAG: glycosyltransferase [Candidatus Methylacidiphilales bacterium]|nr:glycosyltransferase [Candidatus Methylacidiphilales bacterium]
MKVLVSAIACNPYAGSEGAYGWRACRALAEDHEIYVITSGDNAAPLERARSEGLIPTNLHFRFLGRQAKCSENRMVARLQSWKGYMDFNAAILPEASRWHAEVGFDLSHLVTYTTWRVGCDLWRLPVPLVWGPISGTEVFPSSCYGILSPSAYLFEQFRRLSGVWSRFNPGVRATARHAAVVPVTHGQALEALVPLRGRAEGVFVFCNVFFADAHIAQLRRPGTSSPPLGPLRIFGSGNLEGRKGVAIALHALAQLKARGLRFSYTITSRGPELEHLVALAARLGLEREVSIGNTLSREDFFKTLQSSDIYLLPSLREGAGQTMMEAMLAGCAPVVADWCGPSEIVTEDCGIKIPVTRPETMASAIAEAILDLDQDRVRLMQLGNQASKRIAENYNEATYREQTRLCYEMALGLKDSKIAKS